MQRYACTDLLTLVAPFGERLSENKAQIEESKAESWKGRERERQRDGETERDRVRQSPHDIV